MSQSVGRNNIAPNGNNIAPNGNNIAPNVINRRSRRNTLRYYALVLCFYSHYLDRCDVDSSIGMMEQFLIGISRSSDWMPFAPFGLEPVT
jgi:hypothetical protein